LGTTYSERLAVTEPNPLIIVIAGRTRPSLPDEIKAIAPEAEVRIVDEQALADHVEDAEIIVTVRLPPAALARAGRLKWVQSWAAGPNEILHDAMKASPVLLTSCKGNGAVPLAEHAIMLMLMLARDARRLLAAQAACRWDKFSVGELYGKTCGIIGTGHSGTDLARKAKAFHMQVLGMRRQNRPAESFDRIYPREHLHEFLARCDFVVVGAALTRETEGMLGEAEFRAMKPSACYVCFSRGAIADPVALERALRKGWIAGAGLDAHAVEPLPPDSPFWTMPNVIVTPHIGAVSKGTVDRGIDIFLDNLRRYRRREPLVNLVDKTLGY
jgi:phosphoglycerate dehydrogenase-like enzyme